MKVDLKSLEQLMIEIRHALTDLDRYQWEADSVIGKSADWNDNLGTEFQSFLKEYRDAINIPREELEGLYNDVQSCYKHVKDYLEKDF